MQMTSPNFENSDFDLEFPPGPESGPDFDLSNPDEMLDDTPKKKSLFGMFKK